MRLYNVTILAEDASKTFVFGPYPDRMDQICGARGLRRLRPGDLLLSLVVPDDEDPVLAAWSDSDLRPEARDGR